MENRPFIRDCHEEMMIKQEQQQEKLNDMLPLERRRDDDPGIQLEFILLLFLLSCCCITTNTFLIAFHDQMCRMNAFILHPWNLFFLCRQLYLNSKIGDQLEMNKTV